MTPTLFMVFRKDARDHALMLIEQDKSPDANLNHYQYGHSLPIFSLSH